MFRVTKRVVVVMQPTGANRRPAIPSVRSILARKARMVPLPPLPLPLLPLLPLLLPLLPLLARCNRAFPPSTSHAGSRTTGAVPVFG